MDIQDRLKQYLRYRSLTYKQFEVICGLGNGTAARIGRNTRDTILNRISISCPDLNVGWVMTGEGDMIKPFIQQKLKGDNNTQIAGNNNQINSPSTLDKAISEIAEQRKLVSKAQEQIDRLISLLEKQ